MHVRQRRCLGVWGEATFGRGFAAAVPGPWPGVEFARHLLVPVSGFTRLRTAVAFVLALIGPPATYGATFLVVTTDDAGVGSLRQAISDANSGFGPDTIWFAVPTAGIPTIVPATPLPTLTDPVTIDGTTQLPAGWVELDGQATAFAVGLTLAGGSSNIRGLVINGFGHAGIVLSGPGGNVVEGNRIGSDASGTQGRSGFAYGIEVSGSPANRIGGTSPGGGNLISGNLFGIFVHGSAATGNVIEGNLIGTDATGAAALPNAATGIWIFGAGGTIVGGADPAAGNVIAGNATDGVDVGGAAGVNTTIAGNVIGLAADRATPLGNGNDGVYVYGGAGGSSIGALAANWIGANGGAGVRLEATAGTGNAIRGNRLLGNGDLGIDLGAEGVTANDAGDLDGGANDQQNFPVLDDAFIGGTQISGTLDGAANGAFILEVFAASACDPSGNGEGTELLAVQAVTTDGAGHGEFTATLSRNVDASTEYVTATVTDASGNTSEFSPCAPDTLLPTTTTSSTLPPTTTSTSLPPPSTTTSTTVVEGTSTTTTLGTSTTSTSLPPPSTTTSTTMVGETSTTTTTAPVVSTTSTTLPSCSGSDCPCIAEATFDSIRCRLDVLRDAVPEMSDLGADRERVGRLLRRGQRLLGRAEARCQDARRGPSRRKLRGIVRRLRTVLHVVRVRYSRRVPPPREVELFTGTTTRLLDDTHTLVGGLECP